MDRREFIAVAVGWTAAAIIGFIGGITDHRETPDYSSRKDGPKSKRQTSRTTSSA